MNRIDHIVVGAHSLAEGVDYIRQTLGVEIAKGGSHKTMATHNHLMQLGNEVYLELIAIDADAEVPRHPRWFGLDQALIRASIKQQPRLLSWVMNTTDIHQLANNADFSIGNPTALSRDLLSWEIALTDDGRLLADGLLPYCIQWHSTPHPSKAMVDRGCRLKSLSIHHNRVPWITAKLNSIGAGELVAIEAIADSEAPWLAATIELAAGNSVTLSSRVE